MKFLIPLLGLLFLGTGCGNKAIEDGFEKNEVHTISAGWVSAFAVPISEEQVILFDTGGEPRAASVVSGLRDLGYEPADVSHVFLTHGHQDHVAGFDVFEDAVIVGFAEDEPVIAEWLGEQMVLDTPLSDGEIVEVSGTTVESFHLPGHTKGNAAFLVNRVMVMGSTAYAKDDGTLSEPPGFFSEDVDAVKNQIKALWSRLENRQEDVEWLFFSHTGAQAGLEGLKTYAE